MITQYKCKHEGVKRKSLNIVEWCVHMSNMNEVKMKSMNGVVHDMDDVNI